MPIVSADAKRRVASRLYRRKIRLFQLLNGNVDFNRSVAELFAGAREVADKPSLYAAVDERIGGGPVDYLEFGVFEGQSLREWTRINAHPDSRFFGFDTFEGLPEAWTKEFGHGAFDANGVAPKIDDARVHFVKGLFQQTLRPFLDDYESLNPMVVHIDCDIYSGALFVLATLDPVLRPGSAVIFDEFYDVTNEFAAFRDYSRSFYREWDGLAYTSPFYSQVGLMLQ